MKNFKITIISGILLTFFVIIFFHLYNGMVLSFDSNFHLLRIDGIIENITNQNFNYINPIYFNHFGYASPLFYSDFMIYPIIYITILFTTNSVVIYILIFIIYLFITFIISSMSYYSIKKNNVEAIVFAILYTLCNYHIYNIYFRGALSEYIAMSFLPLFILAIYKINYNLEKNIFSGKEYFWFVMSMLLVIYSHALSSIMIFYLYIVAFVIILIKHRKKYKYFLKNIFLNSILILGLSLLFLMPFIEQLQSQGFYFQLTEYQSPTSGYGLKVFLNTIFSFNGILNYFIFIPIIIFAILLVKKQMDFFLGLMFSLLIISIISITNIIPMESIPLLSSVQYQWRFSSFIWLLSCFIAVYSIDYLRYIKWFKYIKVITLTILLLFPLVYSLIIFNYAESSELVKFENSDDVEVSIGRAEYLPEEFNLSYMVNFKEKETKTKYQDGNYTVDILKNKKKYELPITYYKGYESDSDINITESAKGLVEISGAKKGDKIDIYYQETNIQKLSKIFFIIFLILTLLYYIYIYDKYRYQSYINVINGF